MNVNLELHYLLGECYLDSDNVQRARTRAVLSEAATLALQSYAQTEHWSNTAYRSGYRGGFCNEPTYYTYAEAKECPWWKCFSKEEVEVIKEYCLKNGFNEALKEIPNDI